MSKALETLASIASDGIGYVPSSNNTSGYAMLAKALDSLSDPYRRDQKKKDRLDAEKRAFDMKKKLLQMQYDQARKLAALRNRGRSAKGGRGRRAYAHSGKRGRKGGGYTYKGKHYANKAELIKAQKDETLNQFKEILNKKYGGKSDFQLKNAFGVNGASNVANLSPRKFVNALKSGKQNVMLQATKPVWDATRNVLGSIIQKEEQIKAQKELIQKQIDQASADGDLNKVKALSILSSKMDQYSKGLDKMYDEASKFVGNTINEAQKQASSGANERTVMGINQKLGDLITKNGKANTIIEDRLDPFNIAKQITDKNVYNLLGDSKTFDRIAPIDRATDVQNNIFDLAMKSDNAFGNNDTNENSNPFMDFLSGLSAEKDSASNFVNNKISNDYNNQILDELFPNLQSTDKPMFSNLVQENSLKDDIKSNGLDSVYMDLVQQPIKDEVYYNRGDEKQATMKDAMDVLSQALGPNLGGNEVAKYGEEANNILEQQMIDNANKSAKPQLKTEVKTDAKDLASLLKNIK